MVRRPAAPEPTTNPKIHCVAGQKLHGESRRGIWREGGEPQSKYQRIPKKPHTFDPFNKPMGVETGVRAEQYK